MIDIDLTRAADILRKELFTPLGVDAPKWPIRTSVPPEWGIPPWIYVRGATEHVTKVIVVNLKEFSEPLSAVSTLAHEMAHSVVGSGDTGGYDPMSFEHNDPMSGHGPKWQDLIAKIGLEMTGLGSTTRPTPQFEEFFRKHLEGRI